MSKAGVLSWFLSNCPWKRVSQIGAHCLGATAFHLRGARRSCWTANGKTFSPTKGGLYSRKIMDDCSKGFRGRLGACGAITAVSCWLQFPPQSHFSYAWISMISSFRQSNNNANDAVSTFMLAWHRPLCAHCWNLCGEKQVKTVSIQTTGHGKDGILYIWVCCVNV